MLAREKGHILKFYLVFSTEEELAPHKQEYEVNQMIGSNLLLCKTINPVSMTEYSEFI